PRGGAGSSRGPVGAGRSIVGSMGSSSADTLAPGPILGGRGACPAWTGGSSSRRVEAVRGTSCSTPCTRVRSASLSTSARGTAVTGPLCGRRTSAAFTPGGVKRKPASPRGCSWSGSGGVGVAREVVVAGGATSGGLGGAAGGGVTGEVVGAPRVGGVTGEVVGAPRVGGVTGEVVGAP